jgi:hypothetical protein
MRPHWEQYEHKPFYYHPNRTIKPQRVTFYNIPYEIQMMIFKCALEKDTAKLPFFNETIDRHQEDAEAEEEAAMAEAMQGFLYGTVVDPFEDFLQAQAAHDVELMEAHLNGMFGIFPIPRFSQSLLYKPVVSDLALQTLIWTISRRMVL